MKDFIELIERVLGGPLTGWALALLLALYLLRNKLSTAWDATLIKLGALVGGSWSYRRFDPEYRRVLRENHLRLKLVGIRTEEARRPKITDAYVPLKLVPAFAGGIDHPLYIEHLIAEHKYALILGDPGAGKTTLLNHVIVAYTTPSPKISALQRLVLFFHYIAVLFMPFRPAAQRLLPVYLPLRSCKADNETLLDDLMDPDTASLPLPIRKRMPKRFLATALRRGDALVLLDGLDELEQGGVYDRVVEKINDLVQIYPNIHVIITCRKAGWAGGLENDFEFFTTLPLDATQQIGFVKKWYAAVRHVTQFELSDTDRAKRAILEADRLIQLLGAKDRLREVASNPLILSLICLVHWQRRDLPRGRTALYGECLQILLDLWDRIDKDLDQRFPTFDQKRRLLRRIAHRMHIRGMREIQRQELEQWVVEFLPDVGNLESASHLVRQIEIRSGVLSERAIDKLAFSHLTLQEYLVVDYFQSEPGVDLVLASVKDWPKWREPLLLLLGSSASPMAILLEVYRLQPILAIQSIPEIDPAHLDVPRVKEMVNDFVGSMEHIDDLREAIAALVELVGLEHRPFDAVASTFVMKFFDAFNSSELASFVEAMSKSATEDTAELFLTLLGKASDDNFRSVVLSGLTRIGDAGVRTALAWYDNGDLPEEMYMDLLFNTFMPAATRALWELYSLQPPPGREVDWAASWATRLSDPENEALLRDLRCSGCCEIDSFSWPYNHSRDSALAAVVERCLEILQNEFTNLSKFEEAVDRIAAFSMKVQAPLVAQVLSVPSSVNAFRLGEQLHLPFPVLAGHPGQQLKFGWETLTQHWLRRSWKGRKRTRYLAAAASCLPSLATMCLGFPMIESFLPPNGDYVGFWNSLDEVGVGLLLLPVGIALAFGASVFFQSALTSKSEDVMIFVLISFMLSLAFYTVLANPLIPFWIYAVTAGVRYYESITIKNGSHTVKDIVVLAVVTALVLGSGYAGFVVAKEYDLVSAPVWFGVAVAIVCALSTYVFWLSVAFVSNPMASWLEVHPRGREVLGEFVSP